MNETRHSCGCTTAPAEPYGVLRSVTKCAKHRAERRDPATLGEAYYRENGALDADAPGRYVGELVEALGELPRAAEKLENNALEIGCGASPYVEAMDRRGWIYHGLDASRWAAEFMRTETGYRIACASFEAMDFEEPWSPEPDEWLPDRFGLILAAHVFEHLDDAPAAIARAARLLAPGGELWIVVPDDQDLCNPDHIYFFSPETLRACVEAAGLTVERMEVRRYIAREQFIYCRARKPAS